MSIDLRPVPLPLGFDAHGVCRIAGTRVTLLTLIDAFQEGATPEEIYQEYPSVPLADVYAVIASYLSRQGQVDTYLDSVRGQEARTIDQIKARSTWGEIRRRLLSRRHLAT